MGGYLIYSYFAVYICCFAEYPVCYGEETPAVPTRTAKMEANPMENGSFGVPTPSAGPSSTFPFYKMESDGSPFNRTRNRLLSWKLWKLEMLHKGQHLRGYKKRMRSICRQPPIPWVVMESQRLPGYNSSF